MKTCFISAPANFDLTELKQLLSSKSIKAILPFELPLTGGDFQHQIETAIHRADFCIGLLVDEKSQANVYFELGVASALKKPVLILQEKTKTLPLNISGLPVAPYDLPDFIGLSFFLDQFLKGATGSSKNRGGIIKTKPLADRAEQLAMHLSNLEGHATHIEVENILSAAFRESGIKIKAESMNARTRYDFAIWVDELSVPVGNPLLIEVKTKLTPHQADEIREEFLNKSVPTGARGLIVVYAQGPREALAKKSIGAPLVLFASVQDLLASLKNRSFADFVRRERNRLVHGG